MAHFANLNENNIVINVVVVPDEEEHRGEAYLNEIGLSGRWVQTSYNDNIRFRFAGIGRYYNEEHDVFMDPAPYQSWVVDTETFSYVAPVPYPEDGKDYTWNEDSLSWDIVS